MAKSKCKRVPRTFLKLPDLEQSKSAVLNSFTSSSSKRLYDHAIREFIDWYCSEPRLAFNRTVVTRYRIALEQHPYAPSTINLRLAAIRRLAYEASDCRRLSPDLAAGNSACEGRQAAGSACREMADGAGGQEVTRRSRPFTKLVFSANPNDVNFESFRRSEQPTAVVHETICGQGHW
jgi:hypothetical protein